MHTRNNLLGYYEAIAQVSQLMLVAARGGDWETLIDAERCCAALITRLKTDAAGTDALGPAAQRRKFEIIRGVLADDAEIRSLTQPRLREIEGNLGSARAARAVAATYTP